MSTREDYISGLRKLADLLEQRTELPIPWHGDMDQGGALAVYMLSAEREAFVEAVRALPGKAEKAVERDTYRVSTMLDGLGIEIVAFRDNVCRKVVTGTREVTKTIPDPAAQVPMVEVTETVEDIEWVCGPLLAGGER